MVLRSIIKGLTAAFRSPKLLALLWVSVAIVAFPVGVAMKGLIAEDLGASRMEESLRAGLNLEWLSEFHERNPGLGEELEPETAGPAASLHTVDLLLSGRLFERLPSLVLGGAVFAVFWMALFGGLVDRFARGAGRFVLSQFLASCGRYFGRVCRLSVIAGLAYWGILVAARWGFERLTLFTRDVTSEKTMFSYYLVGLAVLWLVVFLVKSILDFAKITSVLDEEPNTLRSLRTGSSMVLRNLPSVFLLTILLTLVLGAWLWLSWMAAPSPASATIGAIAGSFLVAQLLLVTRLGLKAGWVASQVALIRELD